MCQMTPEGDLLNSNIKEKWQTIKSVGVLLRPYSHGIVNQGGLVLIDHKDGWGIPAGHLERGEFLSGALRREIFEETGIEERFIDFNTGTDQFLFRPELEITVPRNENTSSGSVYRAVYHGPRLPKRWTHSENGEDREVRQFKKREVADLLLRQLKGENVIRKPEINTHVFMFYSVRS